MATEIAGFRTLRVKFDKDCSSYHVLYYKKHTIREEDTARPPDRTLFIVNVPPYCDKVIYIFKLLISRGQSHYVVVFTKFNVFLLQAALRRLFGKCGDVKSVFIMKQPGKAKNARKSTLIQGNQEIKVSSLIYYLSIKLHYIFCPSRIMVVFIGVSKSPE